MVELMHCYVQNGFKEEKIMILEQFIDAMKKGDKEELANLFDEKGSLHDMISQKVGQDPLYLEGKKTIEMMFHYKFGFQGKGYSIYNLNMKTEDNATCMIEYSGKLVKIRIEVREMTVEGKIKRLHMYPTV